MLTDEDLTQIIAEADEMYRDRLGWEFDIRTLALSIANLAFSPDGIDRIKAANLTGEIALFAKSMLEMQAEGALEWDAPTCVALRKIRNSNPDYC